MADTLETIGTKIDALGTKLDAFSASVDARFEHVDARFEHVDKRFEQVDRRFEQVDRRFEQVDRRFGEVKAQLGVRIEAVDAKVGLVLERFDDLLKRDVGNSAAHARMDTRLDNHERRLTALEGATAQTDDHS